MAVPASGTANLSLVKIWREIRHDDYDGSQSPGNNISLTWLSDGTVGTINVNNAADDRPDGSAPHAMSEFYSYDHDAEGVGGGGGGR